MGKQEGWRGGRKTSDAAAAPHTCADCVPEQDVADDAEHGHGGRRASGAGIILIRSDFAAP
jgi:hypothetical protein